MNIIYNHGNDLSTVVANKIALLLKDTIYSTHLLQ